MPAMTKPMLRRGAAAMELRGELGEYIRGLREARGMTQSDLAAAVGIEYYTAISAIELGRNSLPPERYHDFAKALGVSPKTFMRNVLRLTNPWAHAMLYAEDPGEAVAALNQRLSPRFGERMNQ